MAKSLELNPYTFSALPLVLLFNKKEISKATGFVVVHGEQHYLVSNLHVFSGLHAITRKYLDRYWLVPDEILVTHPSVHGGFVREVYPLVTEGDETTTPTDLWLEHPELSWIVDIAALPITLPKAAVHHPLFESDIGLSDAVPRPVPYFAGLEPALELDVIGYPFGRRGGYELFGVWTRATIASEPSIPFEGKPAFLVDSRTRAGNSGSPVVFHRDLRSFRDDTGEVRAPLGAYNEFIGIYSHRVDGDSDLGVVFTADAVRSVVTQERSYGAST